VLKSPDDEERKSGEIAGENGLQYNSHGVKKPGKGSGGVQLIPDHRIGET
jgi:hypothetical protein